MTTGQAVDEDALGGESLNDARAVGGSLDAGFVYTSGSEP